MQKQYYVRLPLKKAYNVRDLGGYPTLSGGVTSWHKFLRADNLSGIEQADISFLKNYGVSAVIDLRSEDEILAFPNPFSAAIGVSYENIPLMNLSIHDILKSIGDNPSAFLPAYYLSLIENSQTAIKEIFEFFAKHENGCTLYHCTAGKDRTGIISVLLLWLADVGRFDIISNYEATYTNLRYNTGFLEVAAPYPKDVVYSRAEYIEPVMDYLQNEYGGSEGYLESIGVSKTDILKVKNKLTGSFF
ncbi:MAG: tyrosine-protein phosphatase [Clostridiales bacterium]|jgi:protein-tyrosine phosphatase|nr:tyrosine-protein phosphatase [Clostridiales bacterium]